MVCVIPDVSAVEKGVCLIRDVNANTLIRSVGTRLFLIATIQFIRLVRQSDVMSQKLAPRHSHVRESRIRFICFLENFLAYFADVWESTESWRVDSVVILCVQQARKWSDRTALIDFAKIIAKAIQCAEP